MLERTFLRVIGMATLCAGASLTQVATPCARPIRVVTAAAPHLVTNEPKLDRLDGAKSYCQFYLRTLGMLQQHTICLDANDLERLWETAYALRDREGAERIAVSLKQARPFWASCFGALANGQGSVQPNLKLLRPNDVPHGSMEVFNHLFTLETLSKSPNKKVRAYAELLGWVSKHTNEGHLGERLPPTVADGFAEVEAKGYWQVAAAEDTPKAIFVRKVRLLKAALMAFASCHYDRAEKWYSEVLAQLQHRAGGERGIGPWVGGLAEVVYYSGHSLYRRDNISLVTDNGEVIYLSGVDPPAEINLLLRLSRERDLVRKTLENGGRYKIGQ